MAATATARQVALRGRTTVLAEELYAQHRSRLLRIAKRNSAGVEDAEEALQDALILFIDHFDPDSEAPALAWLSLTLKRRCWALYRRRRWGWEHGTEHEIDRYSSEEVLVGARGRAEDPFELAGEIPAIRSQLAALKRDERRALSLLAAGYSYREIGQLTDWTYTKVNRCIAEGRAALRGLAP